MTAFNSCLLKQQQLLETFVSCHSNELKYKKIIDLGKTLTFDPSLKTEDKRVLGCQSQMYLNVYLKEDKIFFEACSDALISSGLAALLIAIYSDEPPEAIIKCPPTFFDKIDLLALLSPNRSQGLSSLYTKMKQEALKHLLEKTLTL